VGPGGGVHHHRGQEAGPGQAQHPTAPGQDLITGQEKQYTYSIGYSDLQNLMGFTSKKMQNNILNNFILKGFQLVQPFLRICILLVPNDTHICTVQYSMTPKNFLFLFCILVSKDKNAQNFTLISNCYFYSYLPMNPYH
jgi:hypothetical protein